MVKGGKVILTVRNGTPLDEDKREIERKKLASLNGHNQLPKIILGVDLLTGASCRTAGQAVAA